MAAPLIQPRKTKHAALMTSVKTRSPGFLLAVGGYSGLISKQIYLRAFMLNPAERSFSGLDSSARAARSSLAGVPSLSGAEP